MDCIAHLCVTQLPTMEHAEHVIRHVLVCLQVQWCYEKAYSGCSNAVATSMTTPRTIVMASAGSTKLLRMPHMCCSLSTVTLSALRLVLSFCSCVRGSRGSVGALPLINHTEMLACAVRKCQGLAICHVSRCSRLSSNFDSKRFDKHFNTLWQCCFLMQSTVATQFA